MSQGIRRLIILGARVQVPAPPIRRPTRNREPFFRARPKAGAPQFRDVHLGKQPGLGCDAAPHSPRWHRNPISRSAPIRLAGKRHRFLWRWPEASPPLKAPSKTRSDAPSRRTTPAHNRACCNRRPARISRNAPYRSPIRCRPFL